jgi:L-xylulokinase
MDVRSPKQLCTITGTWTINEFISETPITGQAGLMNSLYALPGYYLLEECSPTGAGNLDWVLENLLKNADGESPYVLADRLAGAIEPSQSEVFYLPFLYGSNRHPLAKASFVGLTAYHTQAHILRAVYEGVAFSCRRHIERLLAVRAAPEAVRMAGGAVNSPMWVQMFADVLALPVETVSGVRELGALGCAMSAAVAIGAYPDYGAAAGAMVRVAPSVRPDPGRAAVYEKKYQLYDAVCGALDTVWRRFEV